MDPAARLQYPNLVINACVEISVRRSGLAPISLTVYAQVAAALCIHYGRLSRTAALRAGGGGRAVLNEAEGDLPAGAVDALVAEYASRGKRWVADEARGADGGAGVDEGRTVILHDHLLSFMVIFHITKDG